MSEEFSVVVAEAAVVTVACTVLEELLEAVTVGVLAAALLSAIGGGICFPSYEHTLKAGFEHKSMFPPCYVFFSLEYCYTGENKLLNKSKMVDMIPMILKLYASPKRLLETVAIRLLNYLTSVLEIMFAPQFRLRTCGVTLTRLRFHNSRLLGYIRDNITGTQARLKFSLSQPIVK